MVLSTLIEQELDKQGLSQSQLIRRLGFLDPFKGLVRFHRFLQTGTENLDWLLQLANILEIEAELIIRANRCTVLANASSRVGGQRVAFVPQLEILFDGMSASSEVYLVDLPRGLMNRDSINELNWVQQRYKRIFVEKRGRLQKRYIRGCIYHRQYGQSIYFNLYGHFEKIDQWIAGPSLRGQQSEHERRLLRRIQVLPKLRLITN